MVRISIKDNALIFLLFLILLSVIVFMPTATMYSKEEINETVNKTDTDGLQDAMYTAQGLDNESIVRKKIKIFIGSYLNFLETKAKYYGQKYPYPKMWSVLTRLILIAVTFCMIINVLNKILVLKNI